MTERAPNDMVRWCIDNFLTRAPEWLGPGSETDTPDQRQERLYAAINAFRSEPADVREARFALETTRIGCLWGQTVCDQLAWEWAMVLLEPDEQDLGVVSPSRSHVVFPVLFLEELLGDPDRDQTSLLLYNMLKAGNLPPAGPGEYHVLG
jgi:hypothetical protein